MVTVLLLLLLRDLQVHLLMVEVRRLSLVVV